ncbi:hypothetical protein QOT17_013615 [Balamuthia mandrillaris]
MVLAKLLGQSPLCHNSCEEHAEENEFLHDASSSVVVSEELQDDELREGNVDDASTSEEEYPSSRRLLHRSGIYIVRKILFKFARDTSGLYNNDAGLAGKVASHELKGLGACLNSRASWSSHQGSKSTGAAGGLCFPLACGKGDLVFSPLATVLIPEGCWVSK